MTVNNEKNYSYSRVQMNTLCLTSLKLIQIPTSVPPSTYDDTRKEDAFFEIKSTTCYTKKKTDGPAKKTKPKSLNKLSHKR